MAYPKNVKELRQFLGFVGYYRRFIKDFSKIVHPLTSLLQGHMTEPSQKAKKKKIKSVPWSWGKEQQQAFDTVKLSLVNPPVLAYADYSLPFILHVDASGFGLGAVLYQKQEGVRKGYSVCQSRVEKT